MRDGFEFDSEARKGQGDIRCGRVGAVLGLWGSGVSYAV